MNHENELLRGGQGRSVDDCNAAAGILFGLAIGAAVWIVVVCVLFLW